MSQESGFSFMTIHKWQGGFLGDFSLNMLEGCRTRGTKRSSSHICSRCTRSLFFKMIFLIGEWSPHYCEEPTCDLPQAFSSPLVSAGSGALPWILKSFPNLSFVPMQLRTNCMTKVESAAAPNQRFLTKWKLHDCGLTSPPKKRKATKMFSIFSNFSRSWFSFTTRKKNESGKLPFDSHADVNRMRQKHYLPSPSASEVPTLDLLSETWALPAVCLTSHCVSEWSRSESTSALLWINQMREKPAVCLFFQNFFYVVLF